MLSAGGLISSGSIITGRRATIKALEFRQHGALAVDDDDAGAFLSLKVVVNVLLDVHAFLPDPVPATTSRCSGKKRSGISNGIWASGDVSQRRVVEVLVE